jgi:hypothetical protein
MADNVAITAGSGTTIAADDISSVFYQRVKVALGADGSAADAVGGTGVDSTGVMRVSLATNVALPAGTNAIGKLAANSGVDIGDVDVTSLPATFFTAFSDDADFTPAASSHTAGDCVGAAAEFTTMGNSGKRIMITGASIMVASGTAVASAWRLHLYNVTPPSAIADDSPFDIASGDRASYLGYIDIPAATDWGSSLYVEVNGLAKPVLLSGTSLFAYLTNVTTVTLAAVAHKVTLHAVPLS